MTAMPRKRTTSLSQEKTMVLLKSIYDRVNIREPINIAALKNIMADGDTESSDQMINQCIDDLIEVLRKTHEQSGLNICTFADFFNWQRSPCTRTLTSARSHHVSFNALSAMCALSESMNALVLGDTNALPLVLPSKHILWISKLQYALTKEKKALLAQMQYIMKKAPQMTTAPEFEVLIRSRLIEYCDSFSLNIKDLGAEKYSEINRPFRLALYNTGEQGRFRGRLQSMIYFAVMANSALDYFIMEDYSNFPGQFVSYDNVPVKMDSYSREILSLMLCCKDEGLVNEMIARIILGKYSQD